MSDNTQKNTSNSSSPLEQHVEQNIEQNAFREPPTPAGIENILASDKTREKFCGLFKECLEAINGVFPECKNTEQLLDYYEEHVERSDENKTKLIKAWHHAMFPHYENVYHRNPQVWEADLPYFGEMDMAEKYKDPGFTDEHKEVLWEYFDGLNRHSRIYNAIPNNMLNQIYGAATDLFGQYQTGEKKLDLENMNLGEVKNMAQGVMNQLDKKDLEEFVTNLSGLAQSMDIKGLHDIPRVLGQMGTPGMPDHNKFTEVLNQIFNSDVAQSMAHGFENYEQNT